MENLQAKYQALIKRIAAVRNKQKLISLVSGVFYFLAISSAALLLFILLEHTFGFDNSGRKIIDLIFALIIVGAAIFWMGIPAFSILFRRNYPSDATIAQKIGDHFSAIGDKLVNTIQVFPIQFNNVHGYSQDLMDQSLLEIDERVKDINFSESVSTRSLKKSGRLLGLAGMAVLLLFALFSQNFYQAGYRLLHPNMGFTKAPDLQISVSPGNVQKLKNESIEITANKNIKLYFCKTDMSQNIYFIVTKYISDRQL